MSVHWRQDLHEREALIYQEQKNQRMGRELPCVPLYVALFRTLYSVYFEVPDLRARKSHSTRVLLLWVDNDRAYNRDGCQRLSMRERTIGRGGDPEIESECGGRVSE
jgi:hypothetical protein